MTDYSDLRRAIEEFFHKDSGYCPENRWMYFNETATPERIKAVLDELDLLREEKGKLETAVKNWIEPTMDLKRDADEIVWVKFHRAFRSVRDIVEQPLPPQPGEGV